MHTLRLHSPLRSLIANWTGARPKTALAVRAEAALRAESCPACNGQRRTFVCPKWPLCGCPEGAIDPACPGKSVACTCATHETIVFC